MATLQAGTLIARVLAGSWRRSPPPVQWSADDLKRVTPTLLRWGGGAVAWWRICHSSLGPTPTQKPLRQAYRFQTLQATLRERNLRQVVRALRSAGVEPVLAKGWAVGGLYAERGLRPPGDIDLFVRPAEYDTAQSCLQEPALRALDVDLHRGFLDLEDHDPRDVYTRLKDVPLGDTYVRLLGPEDHLRLLCVHLMHHGVWRPIWLCDVAAALEGLPPDFDWDYCLSGKPTPTNWVTCALWLAHEVLDAAAGSGSAAARTQPPPPWLIPTVLRRWGTGPDQRREPISAQLSRQAGLLAAAISRWPDAVEATVYWGTAFNAMPRLPLQSGLFLTRFLRFALRLSRPAPP